MRAHNGRLLSDIRLNKHGSMVKTHNLAKVNSRCKTKIYSFLLALHNYTLDRLSLQVG